MSRAERAAGGAAAVAALALLPLLGACSWIPFLNSDGPVLTNPAVVACERKARALGYDGVGEHESAPLGGGRYTVVLDFRQNEGYGQVSCAFDPDKGPQVAPPKAAQK
ncbi:MAG TPA: hypothetical protein VE397_14480 [Stellaceae bacterium]|jgi:hypothetical protein|nr:hypothetical protein [Stellaceae bacterium]